MAGDSNPPLWKFAEVPPSNSLPPVSFAGVPRKLPCATEPLSGCPYQQAPPSKGLVKLAPDDNTADKVHNLFDGVSCLYVLPERGSVAQGAFIGSTADEKGVMELEVVNAG